MSKLLHTAHFAAGSCPRHGGESRWWCGRCCVRLSPRTGSTSRVELTSSTRS